MGPDSATTPDRIIVRRGKNTNLHELTRIFTNQILVAQSGAAARSPNEKFAQRAQSDRERREKSIQFDLLKFKLCALCVSVPQSIHFCAPLEDFLTTDFTDDHG
jgi:hypothetical protein